MQNIFSFKNCAYIFLASILAIVDTGCKKFVEIKPAPGLVLTKMVFADDKTALSAVSGVYTNVHGNNFAMLNGGLSLYGGLASDELYPTGSSATALAFFKDELLPTTSAVNSSFYALCYKAIYQANAILDGLEQSASLTVSMREELSGEMKFIRGAMYFYLINLFGDIPLILSTNYQDNAAVPRTPSQTIYEQIVDDLLDAQNKLSQEYPSEEKARPNKWAAGALLARVYLFESDWADAEAQSSDVIHSGIYSLIPTSDIATVFLRNNQETIWEMPSPNEISTPGDGNNFIPSSTRSIPPYVVSDYLLNSFESGDVRKTSWLNKNTVNGTDYWYPYKYQEKFAAQNSIPEDCQVVLRLAEQYLIRAEARAQQNELTEALEDLNQIRNRAGLPNSNAATQADILSAIHAENRVEFFVEQGHRWLDLKRTGDFNNVLSAIKGSTWQSTDSLWPIPSNEINYNPYLTQNPGY